MVCFVRMKLCPELACLSVSLRSGLVDAPLFEPFIAEWNLVFILVLNFSDFDRFTIDTIYEVRLILSVTIQMHMKT
jgi:hypothetical protein